MFLQAAKVGGIIANNTYRADFIYENMMIHSNVIHQVYMNGVKKLLFLGLFCIYPQLEPQPLKEEYLLADLNLLTNPMRLLKVQELKCVMPIVRNTDVILSRSCQRICKVLMIITK